MYKARMKKLIAFLRVLPEEKFDFGSVVTESNKECGSVCCAMGWCPRIFPDQVEWHTRGDGTVSNDVFGTQALYDESEAFVGALDGFTEVAQILFDISYSTADNLFCPMQQGELGLEDVNYGASATLVADMLQQYMDTQEDTTPEDQMNEPDFHPEALVAMLGLPFKRVDN